MTALDPTAWFHYFSQDQLVLVSPALANLDAPDRDVYSASALARPALGLLNSPSWIPNARPWRGSHFPARRWLTG
ncbi:MAG: hypothetical protein NTZ08_14565 [Verrucomicrobia bacterium]|nr:hypothetical protein [Verrucomicrobiota bacterium]